MGKHTFVFVVYMCPFSSASRFPTLIIWLAHIHSLWEFGKEIKTVQRFVSFCDTSLVFKAMDWDFLKNKNKGHILGAGGCHLLGDLRHTGVFE